MGTGNFIYDCSITNRNIFVFLSVLLVLAGLKLNVFHNHRRPWAYAARSVPRIPPQVTQSTRCELNLDGICIIQNCLFFHVICSYQLFRLCQHCRFFLAYKHIYSPYCLITIHIHEGKPLGPTDFSISSNYSIFSFCPKSRTFQPSFAFPL